DLARQRLTEIKVLNDVAQQEVRLKAAEIAAMAERQRVAAAAPPVAPTSPCSLQLTNVSLSSRSAEPLSAAEECALKPKDMFKECEKCPEMLVVPMGSFMMGSPSTEPGRKSNEEPQHSVTISRPFAVGKFHVTVNQFAAFVTETNYSIGS